MWQAPARALFDRAFYVDTADNRNGTGCLYIFLMCLLASLISSIPIATGCDAVLRDPNLLMVINQVPKTTLENGQISIDKPLPYDINDPSQHPIIEFRTNESGPVKLTEDGPKIVITKDTITMAKGSSSEAHVIQMAKMKESVDHVTFDNNDLLRFLRLILFWIPIVLFACALPCIFLGHLFQLLVYALVAQLTCNAAEQKISYSAGMRLAALAITPSMMITMTAVLLSTVTRVNADLKGILSLAWMLTSVIISIVYLVLAASAIKKAHAAQMASPEMQS
jgi:hypothetical protein